MEFHRKKWLRWGVGLVCIVVGLAGVFEVLVEWAHIRMTGWLYHNFSRNLHFRLWMVLLPLMIPFGLGVIIVGLGPFRLRIDERGVTARNWLDSVRVSLPWESVAAIAIRRKPGDREEEAPSLMLWPVPGANVEVEKSYVMDGRPAYALVQVDDIREPVAELAAALRQYAGPRFLEQGQPPQYPGPQPPRYPGPQFPPPGQR